MSDLIDFSVADFVARIELTRPDKLNALNRAMLSALSAALDTVDADPEVRALVVTGAGSRAFCVGADIPEWSALSPEAMWKDWIRTGHRVLNRMSQLAIPVIAAVNGYALGGGLELALAADLRLAAERASFAMPEAKLGIIPGWGGTQRLKALVGPSRAKQMIFAGERIASDTALAWGLINERVANDALAGRVQELAQAIAANAPLAVQAAKALIDATGTAHDGLLLEGVAGAYTAGTEDAQAGVNAFRNRGAAEFAGR